MVEGQLTRRIILLGPQPGYQTIREAVERLNPQGRVGMITAGWEEGEDEDHDLRVAIEERAEVRAANLRLFGRTEHLFVDDKQLIGLLQERQDELRELRVVYNSRLDLLLSAARATLAATTTRVSLEREQESSIDVVRQLDREYVERTSEVCARFDEMIRITERPSLVPHRHELADFLDHCAALVISGGNAAITLNRLRIFGILDDHPELPVVAWSGGAMALSDQIVFFHDSPPQGPGNPEVLRAGIGAFRDVLPLPDARHRLRLDDQMRVALFARRFSRYACVILDERTILERYDGQWHANEGTQKLGEDGTLKPFDHD